MDLHSNILLEESNADRNYEKTVLRFINIKKQELIPDILIKSHLRRLWYSHTNEEYQKIN